ncbi:MAG TPA: ACP S-malonyltransferase [Solirubrobacterales bacterium]|nr:ACP S-malonyltransferase [Solirubrobacterales bacterium]
MTERPDLFEQACAELEADPFERIADGTRFAQPAIYVASLAHWRQAGSPRGDVFCGHSLGELAALVAGGALEAGAGLRLAIVRGHLMEEAADERPGAMLALLGGDEQARELAERFELAVANENAPGQLVVSGSADAVARARKEARAIGLKAILLPVAGAFHSPMMSDAAERFRRALESVAFVAPTVPVFSCTTARPFADVREGLAAALTQPVIWTKTLRRLQDRGLTTFLETGPGEVLTGLVRRTLPEVEARSLAAAEAAHA